MNRTVYWFCNFLPKKIFTEWFRALLMSRFTEWGTPVDVINARLRCLISRKLQTLNVSSCRRNQTTDLRLGINFARRAYYCKPRYYCKPSNDSNGALKGSAKFPRRSFIGIWIFDRVLWTGETRPFSATTYVSIRTSLSMSMSTCMCSVYGIPSSSNSSLLCERISVTFSNRKKQNFQLEFHEGITDIKKRNKEKKRSQSIFNLDDLLLGYD